MFGAVLTIVTGARSSHASALGGRAASQRLSDDSYFDFELPKRRFVPGSGLAGCGVLYTAGCYCRRGVAKQ